MTSKIKVKVGHLELEGELLDTECAEAVSEALPIKSEFETWGDEFYFPIGINKPLDETACKTVKVGTMGYWPPGDALAIFFGPTPASIGEEPVAASEVNIVGKVEDVIELEKVTDAVDIVIEKV